MENITDKDYSKNDKYALYSDKTTYYTKTRKSVQDARSIKNKAKNAIENTIEKENIYTIPNLLCLLRIAMSPYLGLSIMKKEWNFAIVIFVFAAVTDWFDGWIARTWKNQSSKIGSFLDPLADKVLVATLFITLTYADLIPMFLTSMIITRDVLLIIAGLIVRYQSLPQPRSIRRYFDASLATVQINPTFISKVNTTLQLLFLGTHLAAPVFHYVGHPTLEYLWYISGASTIASVVSYVLSKDTYIMSKK